MKNIQVSSTTVYSPGGESRPDLVVVEEPLQIRVGYGDLRKECDLAVTMRTPGHDLELVMGFLFTEGIIKSKKDIVRIELCENVKTEQEQGNVVRAELHPDVIFDPNQFQRNFYTTSSCGVCGISSIERVCKELVNVGASQIPISSEVIKSLPAVLLNEQTAFNHTGGLHAAALFSPAGEMVDCKEDVGRHNAVDKVIGHAQFHDIDLSDKILFLSGRAGFELIQKAAIAKIPIVAAVGAPSHLAVNLAKEAGIKLIGFVRDSGFNVYSH
ncbi:MAG: formate dehydrogenase accessory sulfurtransferase FdhD [Cyclobacteriaceae bacterium]